ncbi:hypothetical protein [Capnocytophaga sp.]|uniref:hypothetical protein n=1 Tax=Capnocytophaga sp. TaxID=44737 RepID=UPI0026DA77ED|nr:hypothetical protein [Capnocytophaga sp.]MDO5106375.1 hypothetical protein [Capnocytophaga sp.]
MNQVIRTLLLTFFVGLLQAQELPAEGSVQKNVTGIQAGFFGVNAYNEFRLTSILALRADIDLYAGIFYDNNNNAVSPVELFDGGKWVLTPIITLQPKVYYNIKGRAHRGKNIRNNGSNYFSFNLKYVPNWFVISNKKVTPLTQFYVVPTFGIRRNFAQHFNYEFKAGLGGGVAYLDDREYGTPFFELSFKIGYDF